MSLLKRLLGGDRLSKYEKEQKRRYKQYVKLGTTTTIVSSKSEPEIYQDYLTRLKSLRRSKKKGANKQNSCEQQDDIFKDPTPIGSLSPAPAVLDAVNRNISIKNLPETCLNDLKELETLTAQNKPNIQLGNDSTHYKQEETYEEICENQIGATENTQPLDKKFAYGNQEHFLDQLDEVIRYRKTKRSSSQDNLKITIQQHNQNPSNSVSNSIPRQKREGSQSPIYEYISDQENAGSWKADKYQVRDTAVHENARIPIYGNSQELEEDVPPVLKPRKKTVQTDASKSPEFRNKFLERNDDEQKEQDAEDAQQIRVRHDSAIYPSENEEQYWGTPPDNFLARSDSFVTTQSEDSFFDCISDDGDIYDDGEKNIMKQISPHYYARRISYDEPVANNRNTDSDITLDESLEPPKYSSFIKSQEPTHEHEDKTVTYENSNNILDDSIEPDSLEPNLDTNKNAIDKRGTHVYTNWAETVRIRERDFISDEESREKVREYEEAQRHDEALVLDEKDSSSTPITTFKDDPEFLQLHHRRKPTRNRLIKLENHNDYSDISIESDRADGKKVTFDFGKSYCQIYEADNSPDDSEMLDSMSALRNEGGQVFTPVDNPLYFRFHERNKMRLNSFDNQQILDDDKNLVFFSYGVQPSPPPTHNIDDHIYKIPNNMDLAFLNCMDGLNIRVKQHYRPPTSVQIIELSDEDNAERSKKEKGVGAKELEDDTNIHCPEQNVIYSNLADESKINKKSTVETFIHHKNELQPNNQNKVEDHKHIVVVKPEHEVYQRDNTEEHESVGDKHDSEHSDDLVYQNLREFEPIYGKISMPNKKSEGDNEKREGNQQPAVEGSTLICSKNEDGTKDNLQPKTKSNVEDHNHGQNVLMKSVSEVYHRDNIEDNNIHDSEHPDGAVYQNLEEFAPIYGNVSVFNNKSEGNNEKRESNQKPDVEDSTLIYNKNEHNAKDNLQPKTKNKVEDHNHEHNVSVKSISEVYQQDTIEQNDNIHDSEHSDDAVYQNLHEFTPIYGNILVSNNKSEGKNEKSNQKPEVEDKTLIYYKNEDCPKDNLQPKTGSKAKDHDHDDSWSYVSIKPVSEIYQQDTIEQNDNIHDSKHSDDAVYQNLQEFAPMYGNISKSDNKYEKNNEASEIFLNNRAMSVDINPEMTLSVNKSDIPLKTDECISHKGDKIVEPIELTNDTKITNVSAAPSDSQSQSLWNSDTLNNNINLIEFNGLSTSSKQSPQVQLHYVAKETTKNNSSNLENTVYEEGDYFQSGNSNKNSDEPLDRGLVYINSPDNHTPSKNIRNPFLNSSNDDDRVYNAQASPDTSVESLNETLAFNSVGKRVNIDNTLSSIEESLTETEKLSITTNDSLTDYTNYKSQRAKTFNNPLSRGIVAPISKPHAKSIELIQDSDEGTSTSITEKPRISYSSLLAKTNSPSLNTENRISAEVNNTNLELDAKDSNENLSSPLDSSTSELAKNEGENSNTNEEIRYPKRMNLLTNSNESINRHSSENVTSPKIFQPRPIFKPRTGRRYGDNSEVKSEENHSQNEDKRNGTMHKDYSKRKSIPIFKPRAAKRNVSKNDENGSSPVYSNVSEIRNTETLSEIKRRLSDVRNIETASKQLEAIQDILLSLKRRVDILESRTDDEYLLLLQTFFKSIRLVSGLECNFDQDLLNSQQNTLKDIQDCMKELNMK